MIEMEHEKLPGRVIRVRDEAAVHHVRAGWRPRNSDADQTESGDAVASTDDTTGSEQA